MSRPVDDANNNRPYSISVTTSTTTTTVTSVSQLGAESKSSVLNNDSSTLSQHYIYYIMVPLIAILVVAVISLLIHLLVRRHRRLLGRQLVPVYHYDPAEANEAGWESELLDDADPPFVRDSQRPIVRGSLAINSDQNGIPA